jgi:hypothetical protein
VAFGIQHNLLGDAAMRAVITDFSPAVANFH